jgi:hypothetical protein
MIWSTFGLPLLSNGCAFGGGGTVTSPPPQAARAKSARMTIAMIRMLRIALILVIT